MKIVFASDHAGFELKEYLKKNIKELGYEVEDCGAFELNTEDDYPDYVVKAAQKVSENPDTYRGIVLGGSGQGEAIIANRLPFVRAVVYTGPLLSEKDTNLVALTREHNDANILSLGARFLTFEEAQNAVTTWLNTPFSGDERHVRRIKKIDTLTA